MSKQESERKFARPQLPASGLAFRHKLSVAFAGIMEESPFGFSLSQRGDKTLKASSAKLHNIGRGPHVVLVCKCRIRLAYEPLLEPLLVLSCVPIYNRGLSMLLGNVLGH
jgi:hypothetical protein